MDSPLPKGSEIGVLGGGQLGKMFAMAAADLGYKTCVFSDAKESCAFDVANHSILSSYDDPEAIREFALRASIITTEFENIPVETIDVLEKEHLKTFYPGRRALEVAQDRLNEKRLAGQLGIPTPRFVTVHKGSDKEGAGVLYPAILKTQRNGYDGKGQIILRGPDELYRAFMDLGKVPCILEEKITLDYELSCIVCRDTKNNTKLYKPFENEHKDGILSMTTWPTSRPGLDQEAAVFAYTTDLANELNIVGLLAVEYFVDRSGKVLFNEMAPRPHNSGHITRDCAITSQFHNHVLAVTGHNLGNTTCITKPAKMYNLIGNSYISPTVETRNTRIYRYNKADKDKRKVGHMVVFE